MFSVRRSGSPSAAGLTLYWPALSGLGIIGPLIVLGPSGAATYALGFYVRSWWAMAALVVAGMTSGDAGNVALGAVLAGIPVVPVVWLFSIGIEEGERRIGGTR